MLSNKYIQTLILLGILSIYACTKDTPSDFQKESFIKTFGGAYIDEAKDFLQIENELFVLGNVTDKDENSSIYLAKTDDFGNRIWQKIYTMGNTCKASKIIALQQQSGFAIIGTVEQDQDSLFNDMLLLLIDDEGNIKDTLCYDNGASEVGCCIAEQANGNLYVIGASATGLTETIDKRVLIVTDNKGAKLKDPIAYPASAVYDLTPMSSGYALSFTENSFTKIALIQDDATQSNSKVEISGQLTSLIMDDNNVIYACGTTPSGSNGRYDVLVAAITYNEINGAFIVNWQKEFGSSQNDIGTNIALSNEGTLICTGSIQNTQLNTYDIAIYELDTEGNLLHEKTMGGTENEYGIKSLQTQDLYYVSLSTNYFSSISMISLLKFSFD
jgi:hypothetical protein